MFVGYMQTTHFIQNLEHLKILVPVRSSRNLSPQSIAGNDCIIHVI